MQIGQCVVCFQAAKETSLMFLNITAKQSTNVWELKLAVL